MMRMDKAGSSASRLATTHPEVPPLWTLGQLRQPRCNCDNHIPTDYVVEDLKLSLCHNGFMQDSKLGDMV